MSPAPRSTAHKARVRGQIVSAAERLVSEHGYNLTSVANIAASVGIGTGSIYLHFPSKADLFAEVFRKAADRELRAVRASVDHETSASEQLAALITTFTTRALSSRTMAWALLAEPVDPILDAERLRYRGAYRDEIARILHQGRSDGSFLLNTDDLPFLAAGMVGMIAETLLGPLSPLGRDVSDAAPRLAQQVGHILITAALRTAGSSTPPPVTTAGVLAGRRQHGTAAHMERSAAWKTG